MQRILRLCLSQWLLFLLLLSVAYAQDFIPNVEPINQPFIVSPTPPFDFTSGRAWGPQTLWGTQKGSTVIFKYVLDWWGLGPLTSSPISDGGQNMRWTGPAPGATAEQGNFFHGVLGTWCLECMWAFEAGTDNPDLYLDFVGSSAFGAHLEVTQIIPPPPKHLFSDGAKQFLNRAALDLGLASLAFFGQSYYTAQVDPRLGGILVLMGAATGAGGLFAGYLVTQDPYDAAQCAAGPYYLDPSQLPYGDPTWGIRYYDGSPDPLAGTAGEGAIPYLWNNLVTDTVVLEALERMAIACYPVEYDRARWASVAYSQWLQRFAIDMSYIFWWFQWGGLQAIDQTYTGWDAQGTINLVQSDTWNAGWWGENDTP